MNEADYPIAVTEQASGKILVIGPKGVLWGWCPEEKNVGKKSGWGIPADAKLRENAVYGGLWMVVADGFGYAAIVGYPSKQVKWSRVVGGNPHAAELLPDGNIAIAASNGGWVRVYASSQGREAGTYGEFALPGAHGALWDPREQVLWAVGDDRLVALSLEGTSAAPYLRQVHEKELPAPWGHDLFPVYGNIDRLWVTTNGGVYQYVKSEDSWSFDYPGAERANRTFVKSVGNQPSGTIVQTVPKEDLKYAWATDTVDLFLSDRKLHLPQTAIYKARIWRPEYQ